MLRLERIRGCCVTGLSTVGLNLVTIWWGYHSQKLPKPKNMGRGGVKRALNLSSGSHKPLSLREEKTGKKQPNSINIKSKLKLEHLQNIAVWASGEASVPSLAALFGHRLAATNETLGVQPDSSLFSCQRCETILRPGFNCTIRIEKNRVKPRRRRRGKKLKSNVQNNVVYECHFCSNRNLVRGTPKDYMKDLYPPKERQKPSLKSEHDKSTFLETVKIEDGIRSKDEGKTDELTLPEVVEASPPGSNSPITPLARTKITLDANKRKRNRSGMKKTAQCGSSSAKPDAEKAVSASSKRKRKSWTSLREIVESSELDKCQNVTSLPVPFSLSR